MRRTELEKKANATDMELAALCHRATAIAVHDTRGDDLYHAIKHARAIARSMMHPDDVKATPH